MTRKKKKAELHLADCLSELRVMTSRGESLLPEWCLFFIYLGAEIRRLQTQKASRLTIALSVPARGYAAAFVEFGFIAHSVLSGAQVNLAEHINKLKALPIGHPVIFTSKDGKNYRGLFEGEENNHFVIKTTTKNSTRRYVLPWDAQAIQIVLEETDFSLPSKEKFFSANFNGNFLGSLFGRRSANKFFSFSSVEAIIIGNKQALEQEICGLRLLHAMRAGSLQDVVCVKQFSDNRTNYKSLAFPERSKLTDLRQMVIKPKLAIFDGGHSYLKHHYMLDEIDSVIILDQTENSFELAANQINAQFLQSGGEPVNIKDELPSLPKHIEVMVYEV